MPVVPSFLRSGRGLALAALFLSVATGCGSIQDRSEEYRDAELAGDLKIPEWFRSQSIQPAFPVPETENGSRLARSGDTAVPEPPDLTENILEENYVVETAGEQSWLLVNELPGRVWPSVVRFLVSKGLQIEYENPSAGLLQTEPADFSLRAREWLEMDADAADSELRTLVQARVSPGVRRRTTEVQLRVRRVDGPVDEFLQWSPQSRFAELEKRLLEDMGDYLEEQEDVKSYSRAALDIAEDPRVRLVAPAEAEPRIELDLNYDRAWAEINRALEEADVPVVDINRSEGLWYVDFRGEEQRTSGFWFWKSLDEPRYTYQVKLEQGEAETLRVTTSRAPDYTGNDRSERLLSEIYENLY